MIERHGLAIVVFQDGRDFYCRDTAGAEFVYSAPFPVRSAADAQVARQWFFKVAERLQFKCKWEGP